MKNKFAKSILFIILIFSLLTSSLGCEYILGETKLIKLSFDETGKAVVKFDSLALIPGESVFYDLSLDSPSTADYEITLSFEKDENAVCTLADFVYAKITVNEDVLCDKLLSELLLGENFDLSAPLSVGGDFIVKIEYYMPESVGNEAQKTEADFRVIFSASEIQKQ